MLLTSFFMWKPPTVDPLLSAHSVPPRRMLQVNSPPEIWISSRVDADERDRNSRPAQVRSGGLPRFHLWNVHITNCNHFLSAEELLQACSSFQCQMSFFFFFPPPCNGIHCAVRGTGRALSAPINKSEEGSGLFHPSLVWSCVCRAGGSEEEEEGGDPDSSMFPAAVPLWELHTAIKHLMAAR